MGDANFNDEMFEPLCKWIDEAERTILEVHLPKFKREQLRVQINNQGILKISGSRPLGTPKVSKFYREVPVPNNCDSNRIRATFSDGRLRIIMPKLKDSPYDQAKPSETPQPKTQAEKLPDVKPAGGEAPPPLTESKLDEKAGTAVAKLGRFSRVAAVATAVIALIASVIIYAYRSKSTAVNED